MRIEKSQNKQVYGTINSLRAVIIVITSQDYIGFPPLSSTSGRNRYIVQMERVKFMLRRSHVSTCTLEQCREYMHLDFW